MKSRQTKLEGPSAAVNGPISRAPGRGGGACRVCLSPIKKDRRHKKLYCSPRCRLLSWAVDALADALREGKADGLRDQIGALAGKVKVEIVQSCDRRLPS